MQKIVTHKMPFANFLLMNLYLKGVFHFLEYSSKIAGVVFCLIINTPYVSASFEEDEKVINATQSPLRTNDTQPEASIPFVA